MINYVIKQSSGEVVYIPNGRTIYFLDVKAPNFLFHHLLLKIQISLYQLKQEFHFMMMTLMM